MDTVLVGGISVLVFFGLIWLIHFKIDASGLSPTTKRIVNYGLIVLVIGAAVVAIDWHSSTWMAARQ